MLLQDRFGADSLEADSRAITSPADRVPASNDPAPEDVARHALICEEAARLAASSPEVLTDLANVAESVIGTVVGLAASRGVDARTAIPHGLPPATVERGILRQSLLNLVLACLALGVPRLRLTASQPSSPRADFIEARVIISGAAEGIIARLRRDPRLGVCRSLCESQGMTLDLDEPAPGELTIRVGIPTAPGLRVLVVDDNPDIVQLFRRYLAGTNCEVTAASSGAEALTLARAERPGIITLDLMMPTQDGWEVLQALKIDDRTRQVPVIVCSVLEEPDLALALGAVEVLKKPVSGASLLGALRRHYARG